MTFKAMLNKALRRTELNVAVAGAMLGSVSSMSKLFPVMEKWSKLSVHFYQHQSVGWICVPWEHNFPAWRDFLKWYHGRPQSECYVMYTQNSGQFMFRRSDIRAYLIENGEREKGTTIQ